MSDEVPIDLERARRIAVEAVEAASAIELAHFRRGVRVELKADRSPVTIADKEAEAAIRALIARELPDHDFVGEESGIESRGSSFRWVVDPLDGTKGFTRGSAFWGPMVALLYADRVVAGAIALPALQDVYAAALGLGATKNGQAIRVSSVKAWGECTLSLGEMKHLFAPPRAPALLDLVSTAASTRCYGDLAGAAMVLEGRADVWIEAGVQIWDLAPMAILAEEAGGRFTDLEGRPRVDSGGAVLSNGHLHPHVLAALGRTE